MNKMPWDAFRNTVGPDLLPVVADPDIKVSPKSKLPQTTLGKTPSVVDKDGFAHGVHGWAQSKALKFDLDTWGSDTRLGFGMRCSTLKAIMIDAKTALGYRTQRDLILRAFGKAPALAVQRNGDDTRGIVLFTSSDTDTYRRAETPYAHLEFLGSTKFIVLDAGRIQYDWEKQLEEDLKTVLKSRTKVTTNKLLKIFR